MANVQQRWVFGYGSLMWRPGFVFEEAKPARIHGFHRSLCVYSWVHRGTPENPGLVLGLDHGGSCTGMAFRIAEQSWDETLAYLRAREQVTMVYREVTGTIRLLDGGPVVPAITYVVDRRHRQYAGKLPLDDLAEIVRHRQGQSGRNDEYVLNTLQHLREMRIADPVLEALVLKLDPHAARRTD